MKYKRNNWFAKLSSFIIIVFLFTLVKIDKLTKTVANAVALSNINIKKYWLLCAQLFIGQMK